MDWDLERCRFNKTSDIRTFDACNVAGPPMLHCYVCRLEGGGSLRGTVRGWSWRVAIGSYFGVQLLGGCKALRTSSVRSRASVA